MASEGQAEWCFTDAWHGFLFKTAGDPFHDPVLSSHLEKMLCFEDSEGCSVFPSLAFSMWGVYMRMCVCQQEAIS